ncbi:dimethyladenosine transferase 2, mitochondrial-like [Brienomyrus brachyistius]|uniref:dimethyladenosine transferase 2, mitochondrial-like n=1 Tax=Brienomyrus brachyistius TaxID=42636 RepID=UPI0020B305BC|nr:dimethyladenosine transferase 2, mitochondrial-like [Brienomyrus brachyistius]
MKRTRHLQMSAHGLRLLLMGIRSTIGCLQIANDLRLSACIRIATHAHKRTYYLDLAYGGAGQTQQSKAELISPAPGLSQRNLSAAAGSLKSQFRPMSRYNFLDPGDVDENTRKALACRYQRHFIVDPDFAQLVADHLKGDLTERNAAIFECNPGPGVLTRALLNSGAQRVIGLESDKGFLKDLQALEGSLDGQLEVVHCDFFKLDPLGHGTMKPPSMYSDKLFNDLGISEVPWTADVPVKVLGILPQRKERSILWKLICAIFERASVFRYGRVQLVMFMSEKAYLKLVAEPGNLKKYQSLSVLWQIACDIKLIQKVPISSFVISSKGHGIPVKNTKFPDEHLCLIMMTPRPNLFSSNLTHANGAALIVMVKQCMTKKKIQLIDHLKAWSPENGSKVLTDLGLLEDVQTGYVFPEQYRIVFESLHQTKDFKQSWIYNETLNIETTTIV